MKTAAAFLAGVASATIALHRAIPGAWLVPFELGALSALAALALALASPRRCRRASQLLGALAGGKKARSRIAHIGGRARLPEQVSELERDIVAALTGLGATTPAAREAARQSISEAPRQPQFNAVFQSALRYLQHSQERPRTSHRKKARPFRNCTNQD